jgi:hypothetical protein
VPIGRFLQGEAFGPEAITAITTAFEGAPAALGLVDRPDPAVEMVAKRTIRFAREGVLDPVRLRELALKSLKE